MAKKAETQRVNTRFTIEQLEQMKTHELADLLANVVLVLKRMPNVECRELAQYPQSGPQNAESSVQPSSPPLQPQRVYAANPKMSSGFESGNSLSNTEEERGRLEQELQGEILETVKEKVKFSATELEKKKVEEVKEIARGWHLTVLSKSTKKELIGKILVRQEQEYSDQFAIQHL